MSVGTPTYIPQNDPHDTLIILNMHKLGKIFSKKIAHQLRLPSAKVRPRGRVGVKILFCAFQPFLNSPRNSEYFEYRHIGSIKKISPCHILKQNLQRPQNPLFCTTILGSVEGGGGCPPPPLGSGPDQTAPVVCSERQASNAEERSVLAAFTEILAYMNLQRALPEALAGKPLATKPYVEQNMFS